MKNRSPSEDTTTQNRAHFGLDEIECALRRFAVSDWRAGTAGLLSADLFLRAFDLRRGLVGPRPTLRDYRANPDAEHHHAKEGGDDGECTAVGSHCGLRCVSTNAAENGGR